MKMAKSSTGKGNMEDKLKLGDRVVYFGPNAQPLLGTVRWLGKVKEISNDLTAGIELVKRQGICNGTWNNHSYFKCKAKHGVLIDANGLMRYEDFGASAILEDDDDSEESSEGDELDGNDDVSDEVDEDEDEVEALPPVRAEPNVCMDDLAAMLELAIRNGLKNQSMEAAAKLAEHQVRCRIVITKDKVEKRTSQKKQAVADDLFLQVRMESSTVDEQFGITVPGNCTLQQLKRKVANDCGYAVHRQQWFFGDDLAQDGSLRIGNFDTTKPILYLREDNPPEEEFVEVSPPKGKGNQGKKKTKNGSNKQPETQVPKNRRK